MKQNIALDILKMERNVYLTDLAGDENLGGSNSPLLVE